MKFSVVKRKTYTLEEKSIKTFKEKMLEYLENEMYESEELKENEKFPYTIEDISDDIVKEALADTIQTVFHDLGEIYNYSSGIEFDDYFDTISFDYDEGDVRDCIYDAVAIWRNEMEV